MSILLIIYLVSIIICATIMSFVNYLDYKQGEDITIASVLWVVGYSSVPILNILVSIVCIYFLLELDKKSSNNGVHTILIKGRGKQ